MTTTPETHPSDIPGQTEEYRAFLRTWGTSCGAPLSVLVGHLNMVVVAELRAAGRSVVTAAEDMLVRQRPVRTALDRLLADVIAHLDGHDCYREDCLRKLTGDETHCPARVALADRARKARTIMGFDGDAPP